MAHFFYKYAPVWANLSGWYNGTICEEGAASGQKFQNENPGYDRGSILVLKYGRSTRDVICEQLLEKNILLKIKNNYFSIKSFELL